MAASSSRGASETASWIIKLGLAFILAYVSIDSFISPDLWIGFLPGWATSTVSAKLLLDLFSIAQLVLAAGLLWRQVSAYAALLTAVLLGAIVLTDLQDFLIVFRDLGLACAAAGVAVLDWKRK